MMIGKKCWTLRNRSLLTSDRITDRVLTGFFMMLILFFTVVVVSYFLLPEGILAQKNSISDFRMPENIWLGAIKIFLYNMISVIFIIIGSIFSKRKSDNEPYMGYGYYCFFLLVIMNAVTLGTWSFSANMESVPLVQRLIGSFFVTKNAGIIEMTGQLFICCSLANASLVMTTGKETQTRKIKDVRYAKQEGIVMLLGFILMYAGAVIESGAFY